MTSESPFRPFGEADEGAGASPHLTDYWQVISRRLWLVLLVFAVTTASAIWAVSRQKVFYQAHVSLQVNDPTQPARGLVTPSRISGLDIFVDPIQSEIQVLRSSQIGLAVADSLGLRLRPVGETVRSALFRNAHVDAAAPVGRYSLAYGDDGGRATLHAPDGTPLASAPVGGVLDAGFLSFVVGAPPGEDRTFTLDVLPATVAAAEVTDNLSATSRENTNLIDAFYLSPDPVLAPGILNVAAHELRLWGARRVAQRASTDISFIEQRLDSARQQLARSASQIRDFKQSRDYTTLTSKEQQLINRTQTVTEQLGTMDQERAALSDLARDLEENGARKADLATHMAELPAGSHLQIRDLVSKVEDKRGEVRSLIDEEQLAEQHPRVRFAEGELDALGKQLLDATQASIRVLEARLQELTTELGRLKNERQQFPDLESRLQTLEQQKSLDQETFAFLQSQLYQAQITRAAIGPYVEVVDPATGAAPIAPRGRVNVFLGALLGLILGVGAAFFLEYLDRTVRTSSDVETLLGIPVLGIIPRLRRVALEEGEETPEVVPGKGLPLLVALDPLDPAAEAYRNLRMNLMFMSTEDEPIRSILFSSPGPDEGKSTSAVNFAVMLAQQGQRILLVDADLRRPSLHRALDLLREPGLTNLLVGDATTREAVRPNVLPNLDFLPSGPFPPNPSELLNSQAMRRLLEEFEGKYSQIIIDSPPVLAVTDAAILGVNTDGAVLVLRSGETEQRAAERSVDQFRRLGVRVFGAVLNEVSTTTAEESYYLQYYYSYHPTSTGWDRFKKSFAKGHLWS